MPFEHRRSEWRLGFGWPLAVSPWFGARALGGQRFREVFGAHVKIERDTDGGVQVHDHGL